MTKIQLTHQALEQFTPEQIESAIECTFHAKKKTGGKIICTFSLGSRSIQSKKEKIIEEIITTLKNDRVGPTLNDRMYLGDTSSENIQDIHISLKHK